VGGDLTIKISDDIIRKGLKLHGVWHYNLRDTPRMMRIISDCKGQLDKLITDRFPLSEIAKAFELQRTRKCGKVVLHPWD